MNRYEYRMEKCPSHKAVHEIVDELNEIGWGGWELCAIDYGCFIFRRELEDA